MQLLDERLHFFDFAGADVGGGMNALKFLRGLPDDLDAGGGRKLAQLVEAILGGQQAPVAAQLGADEERARYGRFGFDR